MNDTKQPNYLNQAEHHILSCLFGFYIDPAITKEEFEELQKRHLKIQRANRYEHDKTFLSPKAFMKNRKDGVYGEEYIPKLRKTKTEKNDECKMLMFSRNNCRCANCMKFFGEPCECDECKNPEEPSDCWLKQLKHGFELKKKQ